MLWGATFCGGVGELLLHARWNDFVTSSCKLQIIPLHDALLVQTYFSAALTLSVKFVVETAETT
jgi:hypothetical protein